MAIADQYATLLMSLAMSSTQQDYYNSDTEANSEAESEVGTQSDSDIDESSYELETSNFELLRLTHCICFLLELNTLYSVDIVFELYT